MSYPTQTADASQIETLFKTPGPHPNGLQAVEQGIWCLDQHTNLLQLVSYVDGSVLVTLQTESDRGSGVTDDGETLWLASTYNHKILNVNRTTGATIAAYESPDHTATGAHGLEWRDGKLWLANPPSAALYQLDPANGCAVLKKYDAPGNRPHGLGWNGDELWLVETNHRSFYCYDHTDGSVRFRLQLPDDAPEPHGMTIWQGYFWYCDANTSDMVRLPVPAVS